MSNAPLLATSPKLSCQVHFGSAVARTELTGNRSLHVALPVLAGAADEALLVGTSEPEIDNGFLLFRSGSRLAGFAVAASDLELEAATTLLYQQLFAATRGLHLYRVWNYVPHINAVGRELENYRRFCRGRSLAFERHFGASFKKLLPAASAVGTIAGPLAVGFLAGAAEPRHFENPRQVPAFEYPAQYGPRAPSFARATIVTVAGQSAAFISGTSAIRGHATVSPDSCGEQLECTLDNLAEISRACGLASLLDHGGASARSFKVYIRHAADQSMVAATLEERLLKSTDRVAYLQADICRAPLQVEIEATLHGVVIPPRF